jgi:hypothetical protein
MLSGFLFQHVAYTYLRLLLHSFSLSIRCRVLMQMDLPHSPSGPYYNTRHGGGHSREYRSMILTLALFDRREIWISLIIPIWQWKSAMNTPMDGCSIFPDILLRTGIQWKKISHS